MSTPEDKAPGQGTGDEEAERAIPHLDVTGEDTADQVKGGFRAVRNTTRGFPSLDQGTDDPTQ